jgi:hypothetical protein
MDRRKAWRTVLAAEVRRWSELSCRELLAKLSNTQVYEAELDGKPHQVEVELLADTPGYVEVMVGVDDGSLPASIWPATEIFRREKCSA